VKSDLINDFLITEGGLFSLDSLDSECNILKLGVWAAWVELRTQALRGHGWNGSMGFGRRSKAGAEGLAR
jgi:hypothetical protein